jgi:hypothetical protein
MTMRYEELPEFASGRRGLMEVGRMPPVIDICSIERSIWRVKNSSFASSE